jgi:hypothetical protein
VTTTSDHVTKGVRHLGPVLLVEAGENERGLGDDCGVEVQLDLSRGAQEDRGDGGVFPSGFSDSFGIPGLSSVGLALRSLGSSGKETLARCTRGKVLIASNFRSGRIPLPPGLAVVTTDPLIIAPSTATRPEIPADRNSTRATCLRHPAISSLSA